MHNHADVVLISNDPALGQAVRRHQPPTVTLKVVASYNMTGGDGVAEHQIWLDLDTSSEVPPTAGRRVYFYSKRDQAGQDHPPGLFIRKPGTSAVYEVLWAGVRPRAPKPGTQPRDACQLPAWILDFHEPDLKSLCDTIVRLLPPRLGYQTASLYLHDSAHRLLRLAESTQQRNVELAIPFDDHGTHLMINVARRGSILITDDVSAELARRGINSQRNRDRGACLIAPLVSRDQLIGVLNLNGGQPETRPHDRGVIERVCDFVARSLQIARDYDFAQTEARVDCLTGLYNQRWTTETLTREIRRSERYGMPLSALLVDLDGLKRVNDTEGHAAGDCLLQHVAARIAGVLREFDGAARIGGDEFVVTLPRTDLAGARQVARRLLNSLAQNPAHYRDVPLSTTAAVGVAQWQPGWNASQLIRAADEAMYAAKRQGCNQLACAAPVETVHEAGPATSTAPPPKPRSAHREEIPAAPRDARRIDREGQTVRSSDHKNV